MGNGNYNFGKTFSEETRKKISEAAKKRSSDPEWRRKISESAKKRYEDPEFRRKASEKTKKQFAIFNFNLRFFHPKNNSGFFITIYCFLIVFYF